MTRTYSVVIATHRRPELVLECIESVLAQTHPALEVLVVDDGSDDGTVDRIRGAYPTVTVMSQENRGRSVASNRGATAATGDFVCLLDDDDLWHPDKLREVDSYLDANPGCLAVNHPVWFFTPSELSMDQAYGFAIDFTASSYQECLEAIATGDPSRNDWSYLNIAGDSYASLLERNRGALSASVIRRDVFHTAGGFLTSVSSADDWLLFLSVARIAEWHTIPLRLAFCRQHGAQGTHDIDNTLAILAAYNVAWFGGRPLPGRTTAPDRNVMLDQYRTAYRELSQLFVWSAVKARRWDLVRPLRALSQPLLRHRADRVFTSLPPRVTNLFLRRR